MNGALCSPSFLVKIPLALHRCPDTARKTVVNAAESLSRRRIVLIRKSIAQKLKINFLSHRVIASKAKKAADLPTFVIVIRVNRTVRIKRFAAAAALAFLEIPNGLPLLNRQTKHSLEIARIGRHADSFKPKNLSSLICLANEAQAVTRPI